MALPAIALKLAAQFAPNLIAKLAGDRAGNVASKIISTAKEVTGLREINTDQDADTAITTLKNNPGMMVKYQQAMGELDLEETRLYLADTQDARGRDIELHKAGYRNKRADMMVLIAFISLLGIIAAITWAREGIKPEVLTIFTMSVGAILKMLSDAFQFEFGSSRGSKEKDIKLHSKQ